MKGGGVELRKYSTGLSTLHDERAIHHALELSN
jgi:hypothetical protein